MKAERRAMRTPFATQCPPARREMPKSFFAEAAGEDTHAAFLHHASTRRSGRSLRWAPADLLEGLQQT